MGQQVRYENLLNRGFHADGRKWVTDISYIHTKQGVLYLSMIRDLYDNSIVAYKPERNRRWSGSGHHSSGNEAREKRRLLQNSTSTATRGFQYTASILQPDSSIRHYTVHVKKGKSI